MDDIGLTIDSPTCSDINKLPCSKITKPYTVHYKYSKRFADLFVTTALEVYVVSYIPQPK